MDWINDVCLSCDRQTADGEKFCSQACRLTDLERAGHSEPATPSSLPVSTPAWTSWQTPAPSNRSPFQLAPPVNFSAYKSSHNSESLPSSPRSRTTQQSSTNYSYFATPSTSYSQTSHRSLTTSGSRSSLSSVSSSSTSSTVTTPGLSPDAMNQLRNYSGAFDTVRDWKRRVTMG